MKLNGTIKIIGLAIVVIGVISTGIITKSYLLAREYTDEEITEHETTIHSDLNTEMKSMGDAIDTFNTQMATQTTNMEWIVKTLYEGKPVGPPPETP